MLLCLVGLVNIASTLLPVWPKRFTLLTSVAPVALTLAAQHATLFAGVAMLLLAQPAAWGQRRAAYGLLGVAAIAVVMNLLKGLDVEEAAVNLALVVALWRARRGFRDIPIRYTAVDLARLGLLFAAFSWLYARAGRSMLASLGALKESIVDIRDAWPPAAHLTIMLTGRLGLERDFLNESQYALPAFLIALFLVLSWTSLARIGRQETPDDLYPRLGRSSRNSLAYLAYRGDVRTFLATGGRGAISYRLVGRVALQVGAILGPASERGRVYEEFRDWLRAERLIPAAVALSRDERPIAAASGMHTFPIGREAVVDLTGFSVERLAKKMRWVQRSLTKRGYQCEVAPAPEISRLTRAALGRIDDEWRARRGGMSYGCAMTLGRFPRAEEADCLIGLLRDPAGDPVAYLTLLPGGEGYYSLDLTRRSGDAPNAAMELLLMETLAALRARGATAVSLNFSTFSGLPAGMGGKALARLGSVAFQTSSLEVFNNKFLPTWTPRYLALRSWLDLPDVIWAILVAEGADRALYNALARGLRHLRARMRNRASSQRLPASSQVSGEQV
ncbi:MAG TPA: phosphatidylglycerol lysyltransferase domain-containing protein [Ktedonobacterales bacterium]